MSTNKGRKVKKPAPQWPKEIRQFVVTELAAQKMLINIWKRVTSAEMSERFGIQPLDPLIHHYDIFRQACRRIKTDEIAEAFKLWKEDFYGVRWAEEKARVEAMSDLVDQLLNPAKYPEIAELAIEDRFTQLRLMWEQIRKERQGETDRRLTDTVAKTLLANPKNVQINASYIRELIMIHRQELGGIHNIGLENLTLVELDQLITAATQIKTTKYLNLPETEFEVVNPLDESQYTDAAEAEEKDLHNAEDAEN